MSNALKLNNRQKAAAIIISMGADRAAEVYKYLDPTDLEKLTYEIAMLKQLSSEETKEVLDEFDELCLTQQAVTSGGMEYARSVFERAFGPQAANSMLEKIQKNIKVKAFAFVRRTDAKNLYAIIRNEKPRTIALILAYATPTQASTIIMELPGEKRVQVVECIAKMESVSPKVISIVEKALERRFEFVLNLDYAKVGGIDYVADVMNYMDRSDEKFIFQELGNKDPELVAEIKKKMFVFEDITLLDSMDIQKVLRKVDTNDLVYALKGAPKDIGEVIFQNVSSRMRETIETELEYTHNVRIRDVEEAQQKIVGIVRVLEEEGEIVIDKGGKGELIS